jgi:hypothetical protein
MALERKKKSKTILLLMVFFTNLPSRPLKPGLCGGDEDG